SAPLRPSRLRPPPTQSFRRGPRIRRLLCRDEYQVNAAPPLLDGAAVAPQLPRSGRQLRTAIDAPRTVRRIRPAALRARGHLLTVKPRGPVRQPHFIAIVLICHRQEFWPSPNRFYHWLAAK